jgi:dTMP kinase
LGRVTAPRFIVFEGLDGTGTTTQIHLLARALRAEGRTVEVTAEPTNGPFGAVLRQAIEGRVRLDPRSLAVGFAADRQDHLRNETNGIDKTLASGSWVLCDRYVLSSLAYQHGQGLAFDEILAFNQPLRVPDLTLFFEASPETCSRRIWEKTRNDELFHELDTLRTIAHSYDEAIDATADWMPLRRVSAEGSVDEVTARVLDAVRPLLDGEALAG